MTQPMKFLQCECCCFLAAIPLHDSHEDLPCPFCQRVKCADGHFALIDVVKFLEEAALIDPNPGSTPETDAFEKGLYAEDSCLVTEPTFAQMLTFCRFLERRIRTSA
jgi:hypothetical protein